MYKQSDVTLRKKARLKIGNFLHTFIVANGTNNGSTISGIGGGQGTLGVESMSAAGVNAMLKILLRVLRGMTMRCRSGSGVESMPNLYRDCLQKVLLPLHKPSSMVL